MNNVWVEGFAEWRREARRLLLASRRPERINFVGRGAGQPALPLEILESTASDAASARVPADFLGLAETAGHHRDPDRWNLLYQVLWRLTHGEPHLLRDHSDRQMRALRLFEKAVRRDLHKMRAFVRFRKTGDDTYVAWYRPEQSIVRANAPFFVRRFGSMRWAILTPDASAYWDLTELRFGPGLPREAAPRDDQIEDLWLTYYSSIFNPARLNITAMTAEMPVRHWPTLPEAALIGDLVRNANTRMFSMISKQPPSAKSYIPDGASLTQLAEAARHCQGCELYVNATQTVFGEGPPGARVLLAGEQPGDQEDQAGRPFVGPAGKILDQALADAGIDRREVYITNAVKHFHFEERGKRRIHKKPKGIHISACRPWLEAEIERVNPAIIVCLGASAAQAILGRAVRALSERGQWMENRWGKKVLVTVHPSALLRLPDPSAYREEYGKFVDDLKQAKIGAPG